jgi:hypothetical protein
MTPDEFVFLLVLGVIALVLLNVLT